MTRMDEATAQARRVLDDAQPPPYVAYNMLGDPYECDICAEPLPDGGWRCPDCAAEAGQD